MINAFSQLGNVAGSYVWNLSENGYRKSYGIVTAMFGITIVGCFVFKMVLMRMNKKLDEEESTNRVGAVPPATVGSDPETMKKGYRYLV
jgi:hypothetical protein